MSEAASSATASSATTVYRRDNVRYLRPLWIRAALVWSAVLAVLVSSLAAQTRETNFIVLVVLAAFAVLVVFMRYRRRSSARRALVSASADAAARQLYGPLLNTAIKGAHPIAVAGTSIINTIYGNPERAEELLATIDWSKQPPLLRGDERIARAVLAYLRGDYANGLAMARDVPALTEIPALAPGAKRLRRTVSTVVDIGRVLAEADSAAEARLAALTPQPTMIVMQGLAAWSLVKAAERRGDAIAAKRWLDASLRLLPHAYGIGAVRSIAAPVSLSPLSQNPYAAPSADTSQALFDPLPRPGRWRRRFAVGVWALVAIYAVLYFFLFVRHR